jgi:hypothetical protein
VIRRRFWDSSASESGKAPVSGLGSAPGISPRCAFLVFPKESA